MLLYNQWITEEIKVEAKKYLKTNNNENMTIHNLWDVADGVLRGKFIAIQSYIEKQEKHQIDNQTLHLKQLKKKKSQKKPPPKLVEGKKT